MTITNIANRVLLVSMGTALASLAVLLVAGAVKPVVENTLS